jgi:TfoX/Sxy family transcriptional regulator of competence genes
VAYNEVLAERIRAVLEDVDGVIEKKMFGGIAFMFKDKMFSGVVKDDLMVRCLHEKYEELLEKSAARPMDFTGKPMRGFLFVGAEDLKTNKQLKWWLDLGMEVALNTVPKRKKK